VRVQLINPPVFQNPKGLTALRPAPPLGLAYIAASLERAGHDVHVIDALGEGPDEALNVGKVVRIGLGPEQILDRIRPDTEALGITNMWSFSWPVVRDMLHLIRKHHPDLPLVCGGEHFNGLSELSMRDAPVDYIIRGEGELGAVEIFGALERKLRHGAEFDPATIGSLVWRDGERVVMNPPRERNVDVDELPWPAWHHFDLRGYYAHGMKTGIDYGFMIPILATRGCPYSCTYCSSPRMWTTKWIPRDPVKMVDEIEHYVKEYGANNFPMQDLTAIVRRDWIVDFCNEILRRGLDIRWQFPSGTRCEVVDDEVAALLWESGCRAMCYAPESGSEETRKLIKKKMKRESLMSAVDAAVRHNINLTAFMVLGFPHDNDKNMRANLSFVRELARRGVEDVALGFFFPIPNTELYDYLVGKGRMAPTDENLLAPIMATDRYLAPERNFSEHIPAWRLTVWRYLILLNFYPLAFLTHPKRVWRHIRNFALGREESKMEAFFSIWRRHTARRVRALLGRK